MSGFKIRTSKYRHVFCDQPKPEETWTEFQVSTVTGDQQYIKASAKFFSVGLRGGGGPVMVGRLDRPGRFEMGSSCFVSGHAGAVLDTDWNPFDDTMFASASEDTNIKIWQVPDEWEPTDEKGVGKAGPELQESIADLESHRKKVTLLRYHPTAGNTLLSTSGDLTVKIWDVENTTAVASYDDIPNLVHDIIWDFKGENVAFSCKDKVLRFIDPRTAKLKASIDPVHEGAKSIKMCYITDDKMVTFGASKQSSRELKVWDLKNISKPLSQETIDTAAGALIPLYDQDTSVLYLCGKGDGVIRIYEYEDAEPYIFKLNDGFRSNIPGKGYCLVPKRGLKIMQHETARILKLTNGQGVHPLTFSVPRKSDAFQDDIFPDTAAPISAHTHAEWFGGSCKPAVTMCLDPAKAPKVPVKSSAPKAPAFKSASTLTKELADAKARITQLEGLLKKHNIAF